MSVDSGPDATAEAAPPGATGCALCDGDLDGPLYVVCYPEADAAAPAVAPSDGVLAVCAACAGEVAELADAWTGHGAPPVAADHGIGEGYRRVADDCSFCDRPLGEDPLLGVEYYRPGDDYANFALCAHCADVFDEFLRGVGGDAGD